MHDGKVHGVNLHGEIEPNAGWQIYKKRMKTARHYF